MKELKDILLEQGIDLACKQMGLCFQRTFLADPPRWHQDNASVSYTHLDVYKRQGMRKAPDGKRIRWMCGLRPPPSPPIW